MTVEFVDPETHEPLRPATSDEVEALRQALAAGTARGPELARTARIDGAYLRSDGRHAYLVLDGVPDFLPSDRVVLDAPLRAR
jgi:hypothetical protein